MRDDARFGFLYGSCACDNDSKILSSAAAVLASSVVLRKARNARVVRFHCLRQKMRAPVPSYINAPAEPDSVTVLDVFNQLDQSVGVAVLIDSRAGRSIIVSANPRFRCGPIGIAGVRMRSRNNRANRKRGRPHRAANVTMPLAQARASAVSSRRETPSPRR